MKHLIAILILVAFLFSCSSLHVEKRRYSKGFYVSWNDKYKGLEKNKDESSIIKAMSTLEETPTSITSKNARRSFSPSQQELQTTLTTTGTSEKIPVVKNILPKRANRVSRKTKIYKGSIGNDRAVVARVKKESKRNTSTSGYYYFLLLGIVPILALQKNRGRKAAKWAAKNQTKAQGLIVLSTLVGLAASFTLGNLLPFDISQGMIAAAISLAIASLGIYKRKREKENRLFKSRLSFTLLNIGTYFGSFAAGAANIGRISISDPSNPLVIDSPALAVLLVIILIAALIMAISAIAFLSCTIACSGYGVLAVIVFIGGSYLATFLASLGLLSVLRRESQIGQPIAKKAALFGLIALGILALAYLVLSIL